MLVIYDDDVKLPSDQRYRAGTSGVNRFKVQTALKGQERMILLEWIVHGKECVFYFCICILIHIFQNNFFHYCNVVSHINILGIL